MLSLDQARSLKGNNVQGSDGASLGKVHEVYADRSDGDPTFVTVRGAGKGLAFVPLAQAEMRGDDVVVPYDASLVSSAPSVSEDEDLSPQEEERLYAHYGLGNATARTDAGDNGGRQGDVTGTVGHDTSGPTTDNAMTRSEEHLQVGTQKAEAGRARLRKYVTTETETVQVPVSKERVTLEREPITEANIGNATDGPAISEEEHEDVLTEERPVVQKEAVPVERIKLGKEQVTENVTVSEEVRKEQIDADGVQQTGGGIDGDPSTRR
ncbi:MAG: hypothetical protein JWN88_2034 [Frankiales bacterium]|nr:hypothetical protein [Frankiales bacterium]